MATEEDIANQMSLLNAHRRTLAIRLEQRTLLGLAHVSPEVVIDILAARQEIRTIRGQLKEWGVDFQPDPNDDETTVVHALSQKLAVTDLLWPDGSILILLPARLDSGNALCISKHPVTNRQYKRFVDSTHARAPSGEHYRGGKWRGSFAPWEDANFSQDDQPVVCIAYDDAIAYCQWANKLIAQYNRAWATKQNNAPLYPYPKASTRLPTAAEWNFAAYGSSDPTYTSTWLNCQQEIVHNTSAPESIDLIGTRTNRLGIADMIGNIWEWCSSDNRLSTAVLAAEEPELEARGGAFIDDLLRIRDLPALTPFNGRDTHHSDLGFRIIVEIVFSDLVGEDQVRVSSFPPLFAW